MSPSLKPLQVGGVKVEPGEMRRTEIPVARLVTGAWASMPLTVVHGARPGPRLWLSAALHGDEFNGIEIIRRTLEGIRPRDLAGAVIAAPVVNVFGLLTQDRYLPDRRDLNRSFPGSARGSMAARVAHLFMREVVSRCAFGIDLHTGSHSRSNWPQIRANLDDPDTLRCAVAFGAPVVIHSSLRDGSLRQAAAKKGIRVLVYEGGENGRFDEWAVEAGVAGVRRVLVDLAMVSSPKTAANNADHPNPMLIRKSRWVRAPRAGIMRLSVRLGQQIHKGQRLGFVGDAFGDDRSAIRAYHGGVIIGMATNPLVNRGEAVVHIGLILRTVNEKTAANETR